MTIFLNTLKRIFRNKIQLFFILLFPLAFMSLGFLGQEPTVKIAIIDQDRTELTSMLIKNLQQRADRIPINEEKINEKLKSLTVDYVLKIDKGFTEKLIAGINGGITSYTVKESNASQPISTYIEQWIRHAKAIGSGTKHDKQTFYSEFKQYDEHGTLGLKNKLLVNPGVKRTKAALGYLIISMLYTSLIVGLHLMLNKNNHTLSRTLAAPIKIRNYMIQTVGSFIFISFIQITFVIFMLKNVYQLYMGHSVWSIYLLLLLFTFVSVSFGVAISSVSKNIVQACMIGICLISPMAMLGGAYFPLDWAPDMIKIIGQFSPVSWVIEGINKLLEGQTITDLGKEIMIICLFAVIFFLIGTLKKSNISN